MSATHSSDAVARKVSPFLFAAVLIFSFVLPAAIVYETFVKVATDKPFAAVDRAMSRAVRRQRQNGRLRQHAAAMALRSFEVKPAWQSPGAKNVMLVAAAAGLVGIVGVAWGRSRLKKGRERQNPFDF